MNIWWNIVFENLKGISFVMLAVHEQVALLRSSSSKIHLLQYVSEQTGMSLHLIMFHYYICSYKQLNGNLKGMLVMLAAYEQVALMCSSCSKTSLLLYPLEQFVMSLQLFVFY